MKCPGALPPLKAPPLPSSLLPQSSPQPQPRSPMMFQPPTPKGQKPRPLVPPAAGRPALSQRTQADESAGGSSLGNEDGDDDEEETEIYEDPGFKKFDRVAVRASMYALELKDDDDDIEDQSVSTTGDDTEMEEDDFSEDDSRYRQGPRHPPPRPPHEASLSASAAPGMCYDGGSSSDTRSLGSPRAESPGVGISASTQASSAAASGAAPEHTFVRAVGGRYKTLERGMPLMGARQRVQGDGDGDDMPPPLAPAASTSALSYRPQESLGPQQSAASLSYKRQDQASLPSSSASYSSLQVNQQNASSSSGMG